MNHKTLTFLFGSILLPCFILLGCKSEQKNTRSLFAKNKMNSAEQSKPSENQGKGHKLKKHKTKGKKNRIQEKKISVLTYNVWFSSFQAKRRLTMTSKLLKHSKADIIALQEVTPWFLRFMRRQAWTQKYFSSLQISQNSAPGGLWLLSRFKLNSLSYKLLPGRMGRNLLVARFSFAGRKIAMAVVHLESLLNDGLIRAKQLIFIRPFLHDVDDAILLGDVNFSPKQQPENRALQKSYPRFLDVWKNVHPKRSGFTWNVQKNWIAKHNSFVDEGSGRIDRIFLYSKKKKQSSTGRSHFIAPSSIHIIGDAPQENIKLNRLISKKLFCSDHFGLLSNFSLKSSK